MTFSSVCLGSVWLITWRRMWSPSRVERTPTQASLTDICIPLIYLPCAHIRLGQQELREGRSLQSDISITAPKHGWEKSIARDPRGISNLMKWLSYLKNKQTYFCEMLIKDLQLGIPTV